MSIGEIAMVLYKSESEAMGQVTELSIGGIGFDCDYNGIANTENVELDLLMAEKGIYLHNLPYATIPVKSPGKGRKKPLKYRTNAVRFKKLDPLQKRQLREMLSHHVAPPMDRAGVAEGQPGKVKA
jgi:hypothetical protein